MVKEMDEKKIKDKRIFDPNVKGVKDFEIWKRLFELGFVVIDANHDKKFICPITNENCAYKSVLYFKKTDNLEEILTQMYLNIEEEKKIEEEVSNGI